MSVTTEETYFVLCIDAEGLPDIEPWKVYRVLPDPKATEVGCLRVIDESGEDYLFPATRFAPVELTQEVQERLLTAASGRKDE
jgi:hypothetical protein